MLKTWPKALGPEEVLIGSGIFVIFSGVWLRWDLGMALTVAGAAVLILGCVIAFGK